MLLLLVLRLLLLVLRLLLLVLRLLLLVLRLLLLLLLLLRLLLQLLQLLRCFCWPLCHFYCSRVGSIFFTHLCLCAYCAPGACDEP